MKFGISRLLLSALLLCSSMFATAQTEESWLKDFASPPSRWANHVIWGMGPITKDIVNHDLDSIKARGFRNIIIEPGYKMPHPYLSDDYFKMVAQVVAQAKKRGMKVWIIDEGKYPSGFAGGYFSKYRPELRMQAIVETWSKDLSKGGELKDAVVPDNTLAVTAYSKSGRKTVSLPIKDHRISFSAGMDDWHIIAVGNDFRTGQTRSVNDPTGAKTTKDSQMDYLNPEAVQQFIDWTHNKYKKYLGKELGRTILGFRGDEPDFSYLPYTPHLAEIFRERKGYDPTPWLPSLYSDVKRFNERLFMADYYDVWSRQFADSYFKGEADWCEANGMEHITHLNKDHDMAACIKAEGDLFRDLSQVSVPGVDAIWNQIWPDTINDYPKFASSVSHAYGKRRTFSETFAAYFNEPTIKEAKYILDYQMIRGINFFEFMFWSSGSNGVKWMSQPGMRGLNEYTNRATWLMQQGKSGARVAVYYPVPTLWAGNSMAAAQVKDISHKLLQHQYDFDYVTDEMLSCVLNVKSGKLINKGGQAYSTIIIPSTDIITEKAWQTVKAFRKQGGKVMFWGTCPRFVAGKSFKDNLSIADTISGAYYESNTSFTGTVQAAMPEHEVLIDRITKLIPDTRPRKSNEYPHKPIDPFLDLSYTRRITEKGSITMFMDEGHHALSFRAGIDGVGKAYILDATTGEKKPVDSKVEKGRTWVKVDLQPWQSIFIYVERNNAVAKASESGAIGDGKTYDTKALQTAIDKLSEQGGGTLVVDKGTYLTGALFFPRGVDIRIEKGATIVSSLRDADFQPALTRFEGTERMWKPALLNFNDGQNVSISGEGSVDGQGVAWKPAPFLPSGRPRLICLTNCEGGRISGLHLRNQASWCLHILYSSNIDVDSLDIQAEHTIPSSDGIDVDSSKGINISNCYIECNDDCISIKSGRDEEGRCLALPSQDITVKNCRFGYGHSGVAMGSEISGGVSNVLVEYCIALKGNSHFIRFKSQPSRGGVVENITFRNIRLENPSEVFDFIMRWRMVPPLKPRAPQLTQLKNIRIENLSGTCQSLGHILGDPDAPLDDIHIINCHVTSPSPLKVSNAKIERIDTNF